MRPLQCSILTLALLASACGGIYTATQRTGTEKAGATIDGQPLPAAYQPAPPPQVPAPPSVNSKEASQRDLQQLQGTWVAVDIEHDGAKETPQGGLKWLIRENRLEVWIDSKKLETNQITLDPTRTPRTIDMQYSGGGASGPLIKGIYELTGSSLKVCYDLTGKAYPKEYSAPRGARRISYVFRRE